MNDKQKPNDNLRLIITIAGAKPDDKNLPADVPTAEEWEVDKNDLSESIEKLSELLTGNRTHNWSGLKAALKGVKRRLHIAIKNFEELLEGDPEWQDVMRSSAQNTQPVTWSAELPLKRYLEVREQAWIADWTIIPYDLAGGHPETLIFVRNHKHSRQLNVLDALGDKQSIFTRIWEELDFEHQQKVRQLIKKPEQIAKDSVLIKFGYYRQDRQDNGFSWFSPLFKEYVETHQTRGGRLKLWLHRGKPVAFMREILDGIRASYQSHPNRWWGGLGIVVMFMALALSLPIFPPSWTHDQLWGVMLLWVLSISLSFSSVKEDLQKGLTLQRWAFLGSLLIASILCLWPVVLYWFAGNQTQIGQKDSDSLYVVARHPSWMSYGDEVELEVQLSCSATCPEKSSVMLKSSHPFL